MSSSLTANTVNGEYRNTIRMCIFQQQYLDEHKTSGSTLLKPTAQ